MTIFQLCFCHDKIQLKEVVKDMAEERLKSMVINDDQEIWEVFLTLMFNETFDVIKKN